MPKTNLIATRSLTHNTQPQDAIEIALYAPRILKESSDWQYAFTLRQQDTQTLLFEDKGYGVDSLQAVIDAIQSRHHYTLKNDFPEYQWILDNGNTGVPRTTPIHLPDSYTNKIMHCIDDQLAAFLQNVSQNKKD